MSVVHALPDAEPSALEAHGRRPVLEAVGLTKRFGASTALDDVTVALYPGEFHALLGENGAGKSTLVKCILGYHRPDAGAVMLDGLQVDISSPRDARRLGLGMVYQHFTLVPAMSVLENLVMAGANVPVIIDWRKERRRLAGFMETMPLDVPLDVAVDSLSAGDRQKTEILKQLYLDSRVLVLDEPTSVLTPVEADEVLSFLRARARDTDMTVLLITHKFSEVARFCDRVTILRKGRRAGGGDVDDLSVEEMSRMMIGDRDVAQTPARAKRAAAPPVLRIENLTAGLPGERGAIAIDRLEVAAGEIVGIAGISGNGQTTLVDVLSGQMPVGAGLLQVAGEAYAASRSEAQIRKVRCLPEEPLRNACVAHMSVSDNLAFRSFDRSETGAPTRLLDRARMRRDADRLIAAYSVQMQSPASPMSTLSGGNVQRAVLARELDGETNLLVTANPCFGLDFGAVAGIRAQLMAARNRGTAVLLVSEDLDEVIELSDRILVLFEGRIVMETSGGATADPLAIGRAMAGHIA